MQIEGDRLMRYAIIDENNIVANVIVFETVDIIETKMVEGEEIVTITPSSVDTLIEENLIAVQSDEASIGDYYNRDYDKSFTRPTNAQPRYKTVEKAIEALYDGIDAFTLTITGRVPADEKASWSTKEKAARAYVNGAATAPDMLLLNSESEVSGEFIQILAEKIIANADAYLVISGKIAGVRRYAEELLRNEINPFEYEAIVDEALTRLKG